jgi:hypothetical protein
MKRNVRRRRAEIVAAVRRGLISLDAACARYGLTTEEFVCWESELSGADQTEPFPKQATFDEEMRLILHQTKYFSRA